MQMPVILCLMLGNIEPLPENFPECVETDLFGFVNAPSSCNFLDFLSGSDLVT